MSQLVSSPDSLTVVARPTASETAQLLRDWCAEAGIEAVDLQPRDASLNGSEASALPVADLVIVEQFTDAPEPIERLEAIAHAMPASTNVIFMLANPTANDMRRLFHAGATDVLNTGITEPELIAALNAALTDSEKLKTANAAKGNLITVLKTAGGVGATSIAANLARTLAENAAGSVVLVDLDVQFAGLTSCLDLQPRLTVLDAIRAGERLDATLLRSLLVQHKSGFNILAGPKSMTAAEAVTPDFVATLTALLRAEFDIVIVDLPMNWSDWFAEILSESDVLMPVLQPSVRCADGARRTLDALADLGLSEQHMLPIINKAERTPASKDRLNSLSAIFSGAPVMTIREDTKMFQKAADLGQCLLDIGGGSAQQDFNLAAQRMAETLAFDLEMPTSPQGERRLGLKLFGERP